jgi:hypothetical protein
MQKRRAEKSALLGLMNMPADQPPHDPRAAEAEPKCPRLEDEWEKDDPPLLMLGAEIDAARYEELPL